MPLCLPQDWKSQSDWDVLHVLALDSLVIPASWLCYLAVRNRCWSSRPSSPGVFAYAVPSVWHALPPTLSQLLLMLQNSAALPPCLGTFPDFPRKEDDIFSSLVGLRFYLRTVLMGEGVKGTCYPFLCFWCILVTLWCLWIEQIAVIRGTCNFAEIRDALAAVTLGRRTKHLGMRLILANCLFQTS